MKQTEELVFLVIIAKEFADCTICSGEGFLSCLGRITSTPSAAAVSGESRSWRAGAELRGVLGVSKIARMFYSLSAPV